MQSHTAEHVDPGRGGTWWPFLQSEPGVAADEGVRWPLQGYGCAAAGLICTLSLPQDLLNGVKLVVETPRGDPVHLPRGQCDPALPLPLRAGPGLPKARAHQMVEAIGERGPREGRAGGHWAEAPLLWGLPRPCALAAGEGA